MLNIEKYKNAILNYDENNINCCVNHLANKGICFKNCKECKEQAMKWLLEEYKEPVLDEAERKYLSEVIRPFRCYVKYISKETAFIENRCRIKIVVKQFVKQSCEEWIILPSFKGDMYKGMQQGKHYTLQELGL